MLPFVFLNVATTVDGKLAPATRKFVPFGSRRDQRLLLELRATADAIIAGARTVDLAPVNLGPGGLKYRRLRVQRRLSEFPLRVVASGSASLNPDAAIFRQRFSPIIILVTRSAPKTRVRRLARRAGEVRAFGDEEIDFRAALKWLREERHVKRLLCEGGGQLNEALIRAGLVAEIWQTVCPLILGGRNAPTLADGRGVPLVQDAIRLRLKALTRFRSELFLVYRVLSGSPTKSHN